MAQSRQVTKGMAVFAIGGIADINECVVLAKSVEFSTKGLGERTSSSWTT
jgi:hypothetical protein